MFKEDHLKMRGTKNEVQNTQNIHLNYRNVQYFFR